MSWLNELEKFSHLKHPIFQGPSDIFQTQTARLIPQQALWGTGLGLHPKPLHTCEYWGWFLLEEGTNLTLACWWKQEKGVRHAWVEEKNQRHRLGEEKGCVAKRKIRRQLSAHMCIPILTFTVLEPRFPFWKDKKGESQVEKWLTFPLRCKFVMVKWHSHTGEHKKVSTWFHHFCNGSCFGAPPWFLFDFNIVNNNLGNQEAKLHPAGGKTGPLPAVLTWLCAVSGYITRTNALEKSSCLDRCCLIWL